MTAMWMMGGVLRSFRRLVEHPEEDRPRPSSRYLPRPDDDEYWGEDFWGEDRPVSPPVLGAKD